MPHPRPYTSKEKRIIRDNNANKIGTFIDNKTRISQKKARENSLDNKIRRKMMEIINACIFRQDAYNRIVLWLDDEGRHLIGDENTIQKYIELAIMKVNSSKNLIGEPIVNSTTKDIEDEEVDR